MHDAMALTGDFKGWTGKQRDTKLDQLAAVVTALRPTAIHCSVELAAFAEVMPYREGKKGRATPHVKTNHQPYNLVFQAMNVAVCCELMDQGVTERYEIIFDEHRILGPRVKAWYPVWLDRMSTLERAIMPVEPIFRDDAEFVPLQAADMLAWLIHRGLNDGLPPREVLEHLQRSGWLPRALHGITWSGHRQVFTRERLLKIQSEADLIPYEPDAIQRINVLLGLIDDPSLEVTKDE
jgi:hypothetical protein